MVVNNFIFLTYFKSLQTCWVKSKTFKKTPGFFITLFILLKVKPINVSQPIITPKTKQIIFYSPFFLKPKKLKFFKKKAPHHFIYRFV
jgi:hypothetical protein